MSAFLSYLVSGIAGGCAFALLGGGLVIVQRVTRVVNLSQGTYAVLAALSAAGLQRAGLPHGATEGVAVLIAAGAGLATGVVAIGRSATTPLSSLILTFALSILAYSFEVLVWGDQPRSFSGWSGGFEIGDLRIQKQYVVVVAVTALVFLALDVFFVRTYLGKALSACASNPYAARIVGINPTRMGLLAFTLAGTVGGVAGVLLGPLRPISFDSDVSLVIDGFAAAIFGGLASPALALGGGLALGVAEAMTAGYLRGSYQTEVALVLMLLILVLRSVRRGALAPDAQ